MFLLFVTSPAYHPTQGRLAEPVEPEELYALMNAAPVRRREVRE